MSVSSLIHTASDRGLALARRIDWLAPLTARITLGVLFASTGFGKVQNLDQVASFFTELGIPAPALNAHVVSVVELVGGALLVVGLASRLASLPLIASMAVAILTAQREQVHGLADLFGLVEWTYLALLVWVAIAGPGKVSLDAALSRRVAVRRTAPVASAVPAKAV